MGAYNAVNRDNKNNCTRCVFLHKDLNIIKYFNQ